MERFFMERLKYIVEDSTIAELLGVQNFTNKESAILELVKNAYDAQANNVSITFSDRSIVIIDDGIGMSKSTICENWMHVGKSDKGYSLSGTEDNDGRVLAGSKGVGRFALARLGASVNVYSAKKGEIPVKWTTNWSESILDDLTNEENLPLGTRIEISALRDRWTEKSIKNLINYLSITCNDDRMQIKIYPNFGKGVSYIFKKPQIGKNFVTQIGLFYDASELKLYYTIKSDEFSNLAKNYCRSLDLQYFSNDVSILEELAGNTEIDSSDGELYSMLKELGNFSAELYFSLKTPTKQDVERFCYNYSALPDRYDEGVVLYRNAFSIASFDGEKDWLGLNQRSRKSPAAATHPTGAWRVRANQLSGKVEIDKKENYQLRDLANRQGLEENEYFKLFVKIITIGIAAFERYRQAIIRSIDKKNAPKPSPTTPMIDQILRGRNKEIHLTSNETKALAQEISVVKAESKSFQDEKESTEKKYRYDVRILNVLATTGLKASSNVLNTTIDGVLNRIIQLRIKISRQNALIRNIISRNQKEINDFLRYAGYHYTVSIEESEGKNYRLLLHYEDHREAINAVQAHLSYGERNALALLLFMYSIKRETPDLVILDDPISSFDGNKKFAIVNMLFKEPGYLRGKTVLLLTHEFGTVVDMVHTMKRNFGAVSTAAFLSTRNGVLQEQQIHADDIKAYPAIAEKNIAESTDPLNKLIYLRRLMEFENNKNDAWQLLSNVFHVGDGTREAPMKCIGNGIEIPMTPDEVQKGTEDIKKYILDFDYQMAYQRMEDQNLLISLYDSTEANYEKLQIYRLIFIGRPMNVVVQKFVNETYHVENDYMFQLDPRIYDTVPQYIVDVCNQAINELRTVQPA